MANPTWPPGVNDKVLLGEIEAPVDNVVRSPMDQGTPKTRRRFTIELTDVDFSQIMTVGEYGIFRDWYKNTLGDGALPFDIRLPSSGQIMAFQFRQRYSINLISDNSYRVSLALLQVP